HLSARGLDARLDAMRRLGRTPDEQPYRDRLERELGVICSLGFDAYYLIVCDFINWAKEHEVPVGPGRGSGAGSLVAFAIGVTDIDPMRYNLLFERFLNPERVSPPDFDVDFCEARREKVIQYVTEKYGRDHVGQIITYNAMKARAVVRDVNRVMGGTFQQGDVIAKLIPAHPGVDMTLAKAAETVPELARLLKDDPYVAELWEVAKKLEGLNRQAGKHAAGVVIADRPIAEYAPLYVADDASVVTQFNMKDLDAVGLIKFDFLGLTALTVIQNAVDIIHARTDPAFRVEDVPDDDPLVFERISAGDNAGVFQMETRGITDLVRRIKPDSIEDITAAIALFRPGPIGAGMVDDFIERKHDPRKASYPLPQLEPVLRDTYGTILYQEQVMLMASVLASFSLGGADLLRRAMGKKNPAELAKLREPFVKGCGKNGISAAVANQQFDLMEKFAGYGFNKSHSAAYAVVGYRMAYLKAHFPTEFLCAVLTAEKGDQGKVMGLMQEAREKGIPVLPPDVERSEADFTVEDVTAADGTKKGAIRFGLTAVKGIGSAAIDAIREARRDGPFDNMVDFLARVDRRINRRVVEALIKCGAMDRFRHTRAAMMEGLDRMMEVAASRRAEKDSRQGSLFDMPGASVAGTVMLGPNPVPEWPIRQRLALEKETIGYYLSGHPLDPYRGELERARVVPIAAISGLDSGSDVTIAGIVINRSEKVSKATQQKFAYVTLEDAAGVVECFVGIKTYDQWAAVSSSDDPLIVRGVVRVEGDNDDVVRVHVSSIQRIEVARKSMFKAMVVTLDLAKVRESTVDELRDLVLRHRGPCPLTLLLRLPGVGDLHWRTASAWCVDPSDRTLQEVEALLGPDCVTMT
ncbi:MAG: DNA polymerase III subunit alpha, partial [Deltaproteobacteria bacterium]|nr:DNA polymerase III subunit alpha [Deltaproteobacteria bacterium]